jgi:phosphinothricin acetyltransferase
VQIRPADPERDATACAAIYAPFVTETAVSFEDCAPSPAVFADRIARLQTTHPFLVADEAAGVVGFAYGSPHRDRPGYRWAADVSVYIAEHARGRGVGRGLYAALLERLTTQGFFVACAGITLPNAASVALHESFGFERIGVYRRIGWKAGAWRDVAWFQCALREVVRLDGGPPAEPLAPSSS